MLVLYVLWILVVDPRNLNVFCTQENTPRIVFREMARSSLTEDTV